MNTWRTELTQLLRETPCERPAALRRSLETEWLYATDLPAATDAAGLRTFRTEAEKRGWQLEERRGWLLIRPVVPCMPGNGYAGPFGPEARCCLSLLRRHPNPERTGEAAEPAALRLIKAGEEGPAAYEETCGALHREWAERLRTGKRIPALPEAFFREI